MDDFTGKVVLITGAGQGVGRKLALAFAEQGAMVAANSLTPINLDETITQINAMGGQSRAYVADIASKLAMQSMLNEITDQHGRLDILIQAAGVEPRDTFLEMDEWDWRRMLDMNLTGPFLLMQSVGRIMRAQGGGMMVNLVCSNPESSTAAPGNMGLLALTQAVASEFVAYNIKINAVSCGLSGAEKLEGYPENLVDLVLFLSCGESVNVSGKIIPFDRKNEQSDAPG